MALVRVGDIYFNIEVEGPFKAPYVMLSNSLGTNYRMWDPQMAELTKQFRVVRYDSRGHGRSHADDGPYSIAQLGRDALAIMDTLGVSKTHWIGLSKGGMVGQWLLTNAPNRIDRAILANTGAHMGPPDLWNQRIITARTKGMTPLAGPTLDRWFTKEFQKADKDAIAKIKEMLHSTPAVGYAACCAAIRDMDQRESIRSIKNKSVLVVMGKHDPATPPAMGKLIASSIPNARTITLNAAHLSNIEDAAGFTRAMMDFLNAREVGKVAQRAEPATEQAPAAAPLKAAAKAAAKTPAKKAPAKKAAATKAAKKPAVKKVAKKAAKKTVVKKAAKKAGKKSKGRR